MKIIITGAGGFLGCTLIESILRDTDHEVIDIITRVERLEKRYNAYFKNSVHIYP